MRRHREPQPQKEEGRMAKMRGRHRAELATRNPLIDLAQQFGEASGMDRASVQRWIYHRIQMTLIRE